jgi:UDP-N-acetylglucosamine 2-epimerase (non-hydrolysing)
MVSFSAMKNIASVVGARPNYMKIAPIHRAFAQYVDTINHVIIHTGQHYSANMSDAFFKDLDMPDPAEFLGVGSGSHAEQTARIMVAFEKICLERKPDLVLVAGDVNSTIACALTAVKCGIRVGHVEAGLRSFDRGMPEEINRIATDSICDYCFVTEQSGLDNLRREGFPPERIFFVGNTMIDSLQYALPAARRSPMLEQLALKPQQYGLVTLHRPTNVDDPVQLEMLLRVLGEFSSERTMVLPLHPRTRKNIEGFRLQPIVDRAPGLHIMDPLGYIDFLALLASADFVLTDSGGIQEETTMLGVPCLTMRTTTERPITCDIGTNVLVPPRESGLRSAISSLMKEPRKKSAIPPLWDGHAAERIVDILRGLV